jgi:hypothetical protein
MLLSGCVGSSQPFRPDGAAAAIPSIADVGKRIRENMTLAEEKALLDRFAEAAGAREMLDIHDLKAGPSATNKQQYPL